MVNANTDNRTCTGLLTHFYSLPRMKDHRFSIRQRLKNPGS